MMLDWIQSHFKKLYELQLNVKVTDHAGQQLTIDQGFETYIQIVTSTNPLINKIIFVGNGGSAGIASHLAIDYSKNGNIPSLSFSDAAALTCLSNDYGYKHVFDKQILYHAHTDDVLVAISSSGKSENILNAVNVARVKGCKIITFSGFEEANPLSSLGDVNFFINSKEYGFVEVAHLSLGHAMLDFIMENDLRETIELMGATG